jgi:hypothetical protein
MPKSVASNGRGYGKPHSAVLVAEDGGVDKAAERLGSPQALELL